MQCTQYVLLQCKLVHAQLASALEWTANILCTSTAYSDRESISFICAAITQAPFFPGPTIVLQQQRPHCLKAKQIGHHL